MEQSAGYVIVDQKERRVLCVMAYGRWDFPKGHLEEGETHRDAAIRETLEEVSLAIGVDYVDTGLAPVAVTYGKGKRQKTATYFFADRLGDQKPFLPVNPELGHPENDAFSWVPFEDLTGLMPSRLLPVAEFVLSWAAEDR